jgi:hypothetical protein
MCRIDEALGITLPLLLRGARFLDIIMMGLELLLIMTCPIRLTTRSPELKQTVLLKSICMVARTSTLTVVQQTDQTEDILVRTHETISCTDLRLLHPSEIVAELFILRVN